MFLNITIISFLKIKSVIKRCLFVIFVGLFVGLLITGKLGDFGLPALQKLLSGETSRDELWELGVSVWKKFPIFGCGYSVSSSYNNLPGSKGYDFHNSFLTILAEIGIWGSLILGVSVFVILNGTWKATEGRGKVSILQIAFLLALELLIAAWSESFLFAVGSTEACTFWILITWINVYKRRPKN